MRGIMITNQVLRDGMSKNGGWSDNQIKLLGSNKEKGWRKRLIGTYITPERYQKFLDLKNEHLKNKKTYNRRNKRKTSTLLDKAMEFILTEFSDGKNGLYCAHINDCPKGDCVDCEVADKFNEIIKEYFFL